MTTNSLQSYNYNCRITVLTFVFSILFASSYAITIQSISSGNWNDPAVWSGAAIPNTNDNVIIEPGHSVVVTQILPDVLNLTVRSNASLTLNNGGLLHISKDILIEGSLNINKGNISLNGTSQNFILAGNSTFIWDPGDNSFTGTSIWIKGKESLHPNSNIIIKCWYDYGTPFTDHISGNIGNLTLNSIVGNQIMEWDQNNGFEVHEIKGTLTIEQAWIILDQSGSITKTNIGNIILDNVNSHLFIHRGYHQGHVTVSTGNITNYYGRLYGILDADASLQLNVSGSFINYGEVSLLKNETAPQSNSGNVTFNVSNDFIQNDGDFRGIFNLINATSGTFNFHFGTLLVQKGIWIGSYACHQNSQTCSLQVDKNIQISLNDQSDLFRIIGLSSIAGYNNTAKLFCRIGENWISDGNPLSEITTCASKGEEQLIIEGSLIINGATTSLNYGAQSAAHPTSIAISNDLNINAGSLYMSRLNEGSNAIVNRDLNITGGNFTLQAGRSTASLNVLGNAALSGGNFYLHGNDLSALNNTITCSISGNVEHSNTKIFFDDCPSSTGQTKISIQGSSFGISGKGLMKNSGTGEAILEYATKGTLNYTNNSTITRFENIKQEVDSGCFVSTSQGDLEVAYSKSGNINGITVLNGGTLDLKARRVFARGNGQNAAVRIENGGTLRIANPFGLFNNSASAAIDASTGLDYSLALLSNVIYYGNKVQEINGYGFGYAEHDHHKYGILTIEKIAQVPALLMAVETYVRTQLNLCSGSIDLNNKEIIIISDEVDAITSDQGYFLSYRSKWINNSSITWNMKTPNSYSVPFASASGTIVPIEIKCRKGKGFIRILTYESSSEDNKPWPLAGPNGAVTHMNRTNGIDFSKSSAVDRWYIMESQGITADVTFSYLKEEETTDKSNTSTALRFCSWTGKNWSAPFGKLVEEDSLIGKVRAQKVSSFGTWLICRVPSSKTQSSITLNARVNANSVEVSWRDPDATPNKTYAIERSNNGTHFEIIGISDKDIRVNDMATYYFSDEVPIEGISYYRISTTDQFGQFVTSDLKQVNVLNGMVRLHSVYPSPFSTNLTVEFECTNAESADILIYNLSGQIVANEKINTMPGTNKFDFKNVSVLSPGTYVVIFKCKSGEFSKRIIKSL